MEQRKKIELSEKPDSKHETIDDITFASGTVQDVAPKIDIAQTFKVGEKWKKEKKGKLWKVELCVQHTYGTGTYLFDIRETREIEEKEFVPVETNDGPKVLYHKDIPFDEMPTVEKDYITVELENGGIDVHKKQVLALVLRCKDGASGKFQGNTKNHYKKCRAFTRYLEGTSDHSWLGGHGAQPGWVIGFRTYVH